jgi:hypothetical protein
MTAERHKAIACWILGGLLLLFHLLVFTFAPERLPEYKQRILAFLSAALAGFFGYFLTGSIGIKLTALRTKLGVAKVDAAGGCALFVLVLLWWLSPFAPVSTGAGVVAVRVTVLGIDKMPTEEAQVWSSVGGEAKKVTGGWEFEIPLSKLPANQKLTVYATQKSAYLKGQREITVAEGKPIPVSIQLEREISAQVKGTVSDPAGKPLAGATVNIVGSSGSTITDTKGFFSLQANAAWGEEVRLRVSKAGYETVDQYHPAGDVPAYVVLQSEK